MKAIVCAQYGGPEVLRLKEVEKPRPAGNEVLVKVHAVSVNDWDWAMMDGTSLFNRLTSGFSKPKFPILGSDVAGVVESTGKNVTKFVRGDEVFGDLEFDAGAFTETTPYAPSSPYSASKAASDHLVRAWRQTYGLPAVLSNCSNNYGPYHFPEKLIPLMIINGMEGKPLPVYGTGENVRDWLHVEDHCEAIRRVLDAGQPGETYNIGGNSEKQNIEVVRTICDILDEKTGRLPDGSERRSLITYVKDRAGHDRRYAIDATKIITELGWTPQVGFAEGMEKTIDWYLANKAWIASVTDGSYREYYEKMYGKR